MTMDLLEFQQKFLDALRSGDYQQARGQLRTPGGFCCLGVATDICGLGQWGNLLLGDEMDRMIGTYWIAPGTDDERAWTSLLPDDVGRMLGFTEFTDNPAIVLVPDDKRPSEWGSTYIAASALNDVIELNFVEIAALFQMVFENNCEPVALADTPEWFQNKPWVRGLPNTWTSASVPADANVDELQPA